MRLMMLLIAGVISGCACNVKKPLLEICVIDVPRNQCACGTSDTEGIRSAIYWEVIASRRGIVRHPIAYCHKAVAMRPSEWEKAENYRNDLEVCLKNSAHPEGCKP